MADRTQRALPAVLVFAAFLLVPLRGVAAPTVGNTPRAGGPGDAVVVAVIDFTFSPYHWDFLASKMPQHLDRAPGNDLPLDRPPHAWLPGFPRPSAFASYSALELSLEERDASRPVEPLAEGDRPVWESVKQSTADELYYYWLPGTKVIGALAFGSTKINGSTSAHGTGTTSVSVGNLHGACPECLLVFIDISGQQDGEAAIDWALRQPWIDVITNSYGFSLLLRDRLYSGSNTELQRRATERGQTIFFSAGNGQDGAFVVPNTTYYSSQEGPDWIVTVGAVSPGNHGSYTGHGRPADIAGLGGSYPSAYGSPTVGGTGPSGFGGTSNATPTIAGMYARSLYLARAAMGGAGRVQTAGVIARGAFQCGAVRRHCELGDGKLTAAELRRRLFHGAVHTPVGLTTPVGIGDAPPVGEDEFLSEGHGTYTVREQGEEVYSAELERIIGPLFGRAETLKRPNGERAWFIVDSFCRQHLWGSWTGGYYVDGRTELPGSDPDWPLRSAIEATCPYTFPPF
jgi:hypothetical protein